MPAFRSRTEHWLDTLTKVAERGGALEISLDQSADLSQEETGSDLVWRVRVLAIRPDGILVEPPAACGQTIPLQAGATLVGAMTVGQNRWMFHTKALGYRAAPMGPGDRALVLGMPTGVERCTRRSFYRISTANLRLPSVQVWPLLDPTSVVAAETANRLQIQALMAGTLDANHPLSRADQESAPESILLPSVGPMSRVHLLNVSGGGLGLLVPTAEARAIETRPHVWLRVDLRPHIPAPVAVTARVAHTHMDSTQSVYAGLAFDFSHNASHRPFVVDLFATYIEALQRRQRQLQRKTA